MVACCEETEEEYAGGASVADLWRCLCPNHLQIAGKLATAARGGGDGTAGPPLSEHFVRAPALLEQEALTVGSDVWADHDLRIAGVHQVCGRGRAKQWHRPDAAEALPRCS